ncbi:class B sortase [Oscillospiraceae bacterium MB08-C2-2]|nr:class B sortase [Oscillospiraceae bacterium MB08-C2-2]
MRTHGYKVLAVLLAVVLTLSLAGCGNRGTPASESSSSQDESSPYSSVLYLNPIKAPDEFLGGVLRPKLTEQVKGAKEDNKDTVGWLQVPGTIIDDVVVQSKDNDYYLRKNFDLRYSDNGIYYADFRVKYGAKANENSRNMVLYGHSMNDNPDDTGEPLFTQLKRYLKEDFAKENPYIFFSTENGDYAYEVFAVYFTDIDVNYNDPNLSDADFMNIISEANKSSWQIYEGIDVSASDHIITLSTCCYNIVSSYPNKYRYVVMGRLVPDGEALKETANVKQNPNPKMPK